MGFLCGPGGCQVYNPSNFPLRASNKNPPRGNIAVWVSDAASCIHAISRANAVQRIVCIKNSSAAPCGPRRKPNADRYDPFYQPGFEQKFNTLRRNILEMEAEAEAERAD
jgi:hypothetical protein